MSKIQNMSDEQIRKAIETFNKKLPLIPEGEDRDLCLVGLENFKNELQRRAQKKSAILNPSNGIPALNETPEKLAVDREKQIEQENKAAWYEEKRQQAKEAKRVVVGRASEITVTIPVAEVKIGDTVRELTQTEIVGYLKTYFKRVAISMAKEGQYTRSYASEMGKTVWRLFDGWNLIYQQTKEGSEWPPMVDIFPGWKHAQQAHKVTADVLWRWASNRKE